MNDDLQAAQDGLAHGPDPNSSFHKLGLGMVAFLRATLGFEPEIMREASDRLADAEITASTDHRKAQRDSNVYRSAIYPPGSEFALCHAQSQLMSAVVGVLNESLTEGIRGFYKLRKAFVTLNTILDAENKYMRGLPGQSLQSRNSVDTLRSTRSARSTNAVPGGFEDGTPRADRQEKNLLDAARQNEGRVAAAANSKAEHQYPTRDEDDDADDDFYDADEFYDEKQKTETYAGHIEIDGVIKDLAKSSVNGGTMTDDEDLPTPTVLPSDHQILDHDPDSDVFSNPIDVFIHSGANLCFGLLLVMISMIPPAFGKLLFIIGFHGDRDRGLRLLWQASKFHNINGAMAGLALLGFYHAVVGFADILPEPSTTDPSNNVQGYPKQRCEALLQDMRIRHPKSHLWLLEEARMQAMNRRLSAALSILESSSKSKSPLKQVEALNMFEKGLNAMYSHNYALCADSFLRCVKLNNWSHSLYYYIAGAAHVEMYRHCAPQDAEREKHAEKAIEYLHLAPKHAGKKKFMARKLPFDVFATRKVRKWEQRSLDWDLSFVDCVGVSPLEEMIFFWNGYRRMDDAQLHASLDNLAWSDRGHSNSTWGREESDERAVLAVLRATTLRNLRRWDDAVEVLRKDVLALDKVELKGGLRDDWTAPVAHYEMGVVCWMRRHEGGSSTTDGSSGSTNKDGAGSGEKTEEEWVRECEGWIEKAAKWESYELDARVGLKIATAQDTLRKYREGLSG
ncbi:MAG: hypothetical protein LQ348_005428 [Seirophora lacunosa]|nr:MAG: hypothetical protein LQ348_005428 [Seirophora lacunosa]